MTGKNNRNKEDCTRREDTSRSGQDTNLPTCYALETNFHPSFLATEVEINVSCSGMTYKSNFYCKSLGYVRFKLCSAPVVHKIITCSSIYLLVRDQLSNHRPVCPVVPCRVANKFSPPHSLWPAIVLCPSYTACYSYLLLQIALGYPLFLFPSGVHHMPVLAMLLGASLEHMTIHFQRFFAIMAYYSFILIFWKYDTQLTYSKRYFNI